MPIPAVNDTDEERSRVNERSSTVDEAAIEWGYSPLILACNTQLRRWQPTNVSKVNTLLLTDSIFDVLFLFVQEFRVATIICTAFNF